MGWSIVSAHPGIDATKPRAQSAHPAASHAQIWSPRGVSPRALPTQRAGFAWASSAGAPGTSVAAAAATASEPIAYNPVPLEPIASPQLHITPRAVAVPT